MKPAQSKAIIDDCVKRGYVRKKYVYYPPGQAAALNIKPTTRKSRVVHNKTGWIDDTRNIRNKEKQVDIFITLVKSILDLDVWPEFYFLTDRGFRFDYAIPVISGKPNLKIAIEVEGGIHMKGNSGHSSGTGIARDMEKGTLANVNCWTLIRRTPRELSTIETVELIKKAIENYN